jgi:hypothetical protein
VSDLEWCGLAALVFASTALLDVAWVHCVCAVRDERALATGAWSATVCAIGLVAGFGVYRWSSSLVVPDVLGAFVGGSIAVAYRRWRRRRRELDKS